jgi:hypothetical protein
MSQFTGWLEKRNGERVLSMLEVLFHRVVIKKIPRQKGSKIRIPTKKSDEAYYILDKKINLGDLSLIGNMVFAKNDIVVVQFQMAQFRMPMRLLGKITKTTSFVEYKRVVFQGNIHFSAVHKGDFDRLLELDDQRRMARAR